MKKLINNIKQTYGLVLKNKYNRPCPQEIAQTFFIMHLLGFILFTLILIKYVNLEG